MWKAYNTEELPLRENLAFRFEATHTSAKTTPRPGVRR